MKFPLAKFLILTFFVAAVPAESADPGPGKTRPAIGLVLSGGGARGYAHIGVLKVLEENRIPVDYIGGTSMGALIGSLYSMGYRPGEMEDFVAGLDWDKLLQPSVSYQDLSFRRKQDRRFLPSPVTLSGDIEDLEIPNALSSGQEIELLLDRVCLPYATTEDFDDLPIPFRAVATDMVSGHSVTLAGGNLSRALRATMSIPGVFTPVNLNGQILADGGLVNNIPTDVVKEMGADILLVVNIETQLDGKEALRSLPGVLKQTINIATLDNSRRSLRQADLIIAPDLKDFDLADFTQSSAIIDLGYQEARERVMLLQGLSLPEDEWERHLEARKNREKPAVSPVLEYLTVQGATPTEAKTIQEKLRGKYLGKAFAGELQEQLTKDLAKLKGTGRFGSLSFTLEEKDKKTGLVIVHNQIGPEPEEFARLEIGLDLNSVKSDKVNFDLLARLTLHDAGAYGAEWRSDLQVGSNPALASEYFRPIGKGFFISPQVSFDRHRINYFSENINLAEYVRQTAQAGFDLGYSINSRSEIRGGLAVGYRKYIRQIGNIFPEEVEGGFSRSGISWVYDGLDHAQVPSRGILSQNSLHYYFSVPGGSGDIVQAETKTLIFQSLSQRNILFCLGKAAGTFGNNDSPVQKFTLGGRLRLGGYYYEEFRADNYLMGGIGILHNPAFIPSFLGGKIYLGGWYEGGSAFEEWDEAIYRQSISTGLLVETPLGPVFLGGSLNEDGRGKIYFSLGHFF